MKLLRLYVYFHFLNEINIFLFLIVLYNFNPEWKFIDEILWNAVVFNAKQKSTVVCSYFESIAKWNRFSNWSLWRTQLYNFWTGKLLNYWSYFICYMNTKLTNFKTILFSVLIISILYLQCWQVLLSKILTLGDFSRSYQIKTIW